MSSKTKQRFNQLIQSINLTIDAQATSTSGRWRVVLGSHLKDGLPCFDVLLIRSDFVRIDAHHFRMQEHTNETYDTLRDQACAQAREFYERAVQQLQEKAKNEEANEDKGLTIVNPDGSEEKFSIN